MLLCCLLIVLSYLWTIIYIGLFLGGFLLADLSFTRHPERLYPPAHLSQDNPNPRMPLAKKVLYSFMLLLGFFFISEPLMGDLQRSWGPWPFLDRMIPSVYTNTGALRQHFWLGIGAMLIIYSLDCYPTLQTPLRWNFSRYLGEVSFGLYVMHIPVVWLLNDTILSPRRVAYFGDVYWMKIPVMVVVYAASLWAADLFTRVDNKVVAASKALQDRFFVW